MQVSRKSVYGLALVLGLSAALDAIVAVKASITTDETHHIQYGLHILHLTPDRIADGYLYDSNMPVTALNALPLDIASRMEARNVLHPLSGGANLIMVRLVTVLASLVLGLLVYLWAYDLYGQAPALASCLLCALSPNLIAHGTLATTDMYHALGVVGSLFFFRRFLLQPTTGRAFISALVLAVAQITKPFALVLYVIVAMFLTCGVLRRTGPPSLTKKQVIAFTAMAVVCFVAVLNVAFSFDGTLKPLNYFLRAHPHLEAAVRNRFQRLPIVAQLPLPVPYPFVQGLYMAKYDEQGGRTFGNIYLLGETRDTTNPAVHGFKSYYLVAYFYKEPIALQILFLWGLVWAWRNRPPADFLLGEGLLLLSVGVLVVWLSLLSKAQVGIRHILPALAIETIIAGAAFSNFKSKPWTQKALLGGLVLWLAASIASYYPQMIPYMNEWVRDRRFAYRILADSNLDWGQDQAIVDGFLREHPDVVLDPPGPLAGRVLVRANRLTGIYRWDSAAYLTQHYVPIAQVGYAHFLFSIPSRDVNVASAPK